MIILMIGIVHGDLHYHNLKNCNRHLKFPITPCYLKNASMNEFTKNMKSFIETFLYRKQGVTRNLMLSIAIFG